MILYSWCTQEHRPVGSDGITLGLEEVPQAEVGLLRKAVTESEDILCVCVCVCDDWSVKCTTL